MKSSALALLCALVPALPALAQGTPEQTAAPAQAAAPAGNSATATGDQPAAGQPAADQTGAADDADTVAATDRPPANFDSGTIVAPRVYQPDGQPSDVVFLISDIAGWSATDETEAQSLQKRGIAVIGLDLPSYLAGLEKHPDDDTCAYAISDIEELSKRLQADSNGEYRTPIIAGTGEGAALAFSYGSQMPASTVAGIVAVNPAKGIVLKAPLCTDAAYHAEGDHTVYDFVKGDMNIDIDAVFAKGADPAALAYTKDMAKAFPRVTVETSTADPAKALSSAIDAEIARVSKAETEPMNLPLTVLPVDKPALDTLAVIYSGDGGWRDIDREIGKALVAENIPVVGFDSLRYFWNERDPQDVADDLVKVMKHYQKAWGVRHVLLIGYSFGADILPATYNLLPEAQKSSVSQLTLLGLTHERDYVIHVDGWLGMSSGSKNDPTDDLAKIQPTLVQCLYGEGDDDDACHSLPAEKGYELIKLEGGHHFDGDYADLTRLITKGLRTRLGK